MIYIEENLKSLYFSHLRFWRHLPDTANPRVQGDSADCSNAAFGRGKWLWRCLTVGAVKALGAIVP